MIIQPWICSLLEIENCSPFDDGCKTALPETKPCLRALALRQRGGRLELCRDRRRARNRRPDAPAAAWGLPQTVRRALKRLVDYEIFLRRVINHIRAQPAFSKFPACYFETRRRAGGRIEPPAGAFLPGRQALICGGTDPPEGCEGPRGCLAPGYGSDGGTKILES